MLTGLREAYMGFSVAKRKTRYKTLKVHQVRYVWFRISHKYLEQQNPPTPPKTVLWHSTIWLFCTLCIKVGFAWTLLLSFSPSCRYSIHLYFSLPLLISWDIRRLLTIWNCHYMTIFDLQNPAISLHSDELKALGIGAHFSHLHISHNAFYMEEYL